MAAREASPAPARSPAREARLGLTPSGERGEVRPVVFGPQACGRPPGRAVRRAGHACRLGRQVRPVRLRRCDPVRPCARPGWRDRIRPAGTSSRAMAAATVASSLAVRAAPARSPAAQAPTRHSRHDSCQSVVSASCARPWSTMSRAPRGSWRHNARSAAAPWTGPLNWAPITCLISSRPRSIPVSASSKAPDPTMNGRLFASRYASGPDPFGVRATVSSSELRACAQSPTR